MGPNKRYVRYVAPVMAAALVLSLAACGSSSSGTGTSQSTLDQIVSRGTIRVGTILSLPPFGMKDASGNPQGFDVDIANDIAKALGVKLEVVDTTAADRIPNLTTGKVDLIVADFTRTAERAKSISFTDPYIAAGYNLLVKKDSGIKGVADLTGKTVAVPKGTTEDVAITTANPQAKIARFDTTAACILAVKQGQADAMVEDSNVLLYQAKLDSTLEVSKESVLPVEYNGFGLRRGDPDWQSWLNLFLFNEITSGRETELYQNWFGQAPLFPLNPQY
jgi:polar amino acid transport system substrate-binding protein